MKAIRLGNDIEFVWTVEGLTNVLGTKLVQLFNVNKGIPETMTYEISGDNISVDELIGIEIFCNEMNFKSFIYT